MTTFAISSRYRLYLKLYLGPNFKIKFKDALGAIWNFTTKFWLNNDGNRFRGWGTATLETRKEEDVSNPISFERCPDATAWRLTDLNKLCTKGCKLVSYFASRSLNLKISPQRDPTLNIKHIQLTANVGGETHIISGIRYLRRSFRYEHPFALNISNFMYIQLYLERVTGSLT